MLAMEFEKKEGSLLTIWQKSMELNDILSSLVSPLVNDFLAADLLDRN